MTSLADGGPTSQKRSVLPAALPVAGLGGLSLPIPTFSHPTESNTLTSENRQHGPAGIQGVQLPGNLPEASLPDCSQTFSGPFTAALKFFKYL